MMGLEVQAEDRERQAMYKMLLSLKHLPEASLNPPPHQIIPICLFNNHLQKSHKTPQQKFYCCLEK